MKFVVAGLNPKDWAIAERVPGINQGDDIAGTIHGVGSNITNSKTGDCVARFHEMLTPHGAFAEFVDGLEATTFHSPSFVSSEEAATIRLAGVTATLGMYQRLGLPLPWLRAQEILPLVVYGAANAIDAFAVKLASLSNCHPIRLIDEAKGDTIVDYRGGNEDVAKELQQALGENEKLCYAFDAVTDRGNYQNLTKVTDMSKGRIVLVLARKKYEGIPENSAKFFTQVGRVHSQSYPGMIDEGRLVGLLGDQEFGAVMYKFFEQGLK